MPTALQLRLLSLRVAPEAFTETPATWTVGLNGETLVFHEAQRAYLPGPEEPEVVVVIEPASVHVFEYHSVDYMTRS